MPAHAYAYLGPGFGFGAIASLFALGSAFFITLFNFIWLPIKHFLGLEKAVDNPLEDADKNSNDSDKTPSSNKE